MGSLMKTRSASEWLRLFTDAAFYLSLFSFTLYALFELLYLFRPPDFIRVSVVVLTMVSAPVLLLSTIVAIPICRRKRYVLYLLWAIFLTLLLGTAILVTFGQAWFN